MSVSCKEDKEMNMSFYTGAAGAGQFTKKLSVVSNNLANINNTGFKPKTAAFSELIHYNLNDSENAQTELQTGAGARVERTWTDFSTAGATQTGKEYDYAIMEPNAFFMIQDPTSGEITYTRNGHFHRENVKMDFNHPLAGKDLYFKGKVLAVRDATDEELEKLHSSKCGGCHGCGSEGGCDSEHSCGDGCCH